MRADEAMKSTKSDGYIYLNGNRAFLREGILQWYFNGVLVSMASILSDDWQPSKPVELCEACKEATTFVKMCWEVNHLRNFHCTCKKEV